MPNVINEILEFHTLQLEYIEPLILNESNFNILTIQNKINKIKKLLNNLSINRNLKEKILLIPSKDLKLNVELLTEKVKEFKKYLDSKNLEDKKLDILDYIVTVNSFLAKIKQSILGIEIILKNLKADEEKRHKEYKKIA